MKLRFRGNTLRLRINQREVQLLAAGVPLQEQVVFPGMTRLQYILEPVAEIAPMASFLENTIRVAIPANEIGNWAVNEEIGLYFDLPAGEGTLRLLVEKDLECIDGPPEERDPDAFVRIPGKNC